MILKEYYNFVDIFSKKEFDILLLLRLEIDYKIKLINKYALGYYPLYKMFIKQL